MEVMVLWLREGTWDRVSPCIAPRGGHRAYMDSLGSYARLPVLKRKVQASNSAADGACGGTSMEGIWFSHLSRAWPTRTDRIEAPASGCRRGPHFCGVGLAC